MNGSQDAILMRRWDGELPQVWASVTFWDRERSHGDLAVTVVRLSEGWPVDHAVQQVRLDEPAGVVVLDVAFVDDDGDHEREATEWTLLARLLTPLVAEVDAEVALVGIVYGGGDLPTDPWDDACEAWHDGYVRLRSLSIEQRGRFEALVAQGSALRCHRGIAWASGGLLDPTTDGIPARPSNVDPYVAWSGTQPPRPRPAPDVPPIDLLDVNLPVLWVYDPRRDDTDLGDLVRGSVPATFEVHVDDEVPGWSRVDVYPPADLTDQEVLLGHLRDIARTVHPALVALLPQRGFLLPGVDLDVPASGRLDHVWVEDAWVGDRREELRAALHPVVPERVGAGDLYVTYSDLRAPGGATTPYGTGGALDEHLTSAATIFGEIAVRHHSPEAL